MIPNFEPGIFVLPFGTQCLHAFTLGFFDSFVFDSIVCCNVNLFPTNELQRHLRDRRGRTELRLIMECKSWNMFDSGACLGILTITRAIYIWLRSFLNHCKHNLKGYNSYVYDFIIFRRYLTQKGKSFSTAEWIMYDVALCSRV